MRKLWRVIDGVWRSGHTSRLFNLGLVSRQSAQEGGPKRLRLARAGRAADHLASAVGFHHDCDPGGDPDNAPGLVDFDVDRFEPEICNLPSIGREREAFTRLSMSPRQSHCRVTLATTGSR